jgi:hypothetical protein
MISFDVVMDGVATGIPYSAGIVLFDGTGTRNSLNSAGMAQGTAAVLKTVGGNASTDGAYTTITFSYTAGDPVVDNNGAGSGTSTTWLPALLGKDVALRFKGATNSAIIDNVSVTVVPIPEPSSLAMLAFGIISLWLFRRKTVWS